MSDHRATSPISVPHQRRSSLASLSLGSQPVRPHPIATSTPGASTSAGSRPRRLSITTLGLSGSPTQTSPFGASASAGGNGNGKHLRGGSLSSSTGSAAGYPEELISEEGENLSATTTGGSGSGSGPNPSPFSRRVSFGAHALRDVRRGSVNNGMNFSKKTKTAKEKKKLIETDERSSWSESLRTRAGRAPSLSNITLSGSPTAQNQSQNSAMSAAANRQIEQHRAASIAAMEMEPPAREIPRQSKHNKPDFFQEKILRGDFMD